MEPRMIKTLDKISSINKEAERDKEIVEIYNNLPHLQQRQYSTKAQLLQLSNIGVKLGLYDAVDVLKDMLK